MCCSGMENTFQRHGTLKKHPSCLSSWKCDGSLTLCMSNYLGHHVATGGPSKVHQVLQTKLLQGVAKARSLTALVFKISKLCYQTIHTSTEAQITVNSISSPGTHSNTSPYSRDLHLFNLDTPHSVGPGHTGSTLPLPLPISREPGSGARKARRTSWTTHKGLTQNQIVQRLCAITYLQKNDG